MISVLDDKVLQSITKKYGQGAIFKLDQKDITPIPVISTGSYNLDIALGVGGLPRGRITEIAGDESSGKTTLCQSVVAQCQQLGGIAAFVDVEHALDPEWMQTTGIDTSSVYVSQPDTAEQALDIVKALVLAKVDVIIVDSVAGLVPRAEIEGEIGDAHIGLQARLMSQTLRQLVGIVKEHQTVLIFTNQLRDKFGTSWGFDNSTTPGGRALRFYASIRIWLSSSLEKEGDTIVGSKVRATIKKTKVSPPGKRTEFKIKSTMGIDWVDELITIGSDIGAIEKTSNAWYKIGEEKINGKDALRQKLIENPLILNVVEDAVRQHIGLPIRRLKIDNKV